MINRMSEPKPDNWGYIVFNSKTDDIEYFIQGLSEKMARDLLPNAYLDYLGDWRDGDNNWKVALIHVTEVHG